MGPRICCHRIRQSSALLFSCICDKHDMSSIYIGTGHGRHLSPLSVLSLGRWHQEPIRMTTGEKVNSHQQHGFEYFIGKYKPTSYY